MSSFLPSKRAALAAGLFTALTFAALGACGELHVDGTEEGDATAPGADARARRDGAVAPDANDPTHPHPTGKDAGKDARNDFVDPTCPDKPPPNKEFTCDPVEQTGCQPGEQCAPFVDYPSDNCTAETYGAVCVRAGTLQQGESCESQLDCAAGFVCLITGAGTTCGRACDLTSSDSCGNGLICVATDVSGIGACY